MAVLAGVVLIAVILQSAVFGFESPTGAAADGTYEYLPNGTEAGNWTENCTLPYNETSPCNQTLPGNDTGNFTEPDNETLPGNETGNSTEPGNETLPGNDTLPRNETGNSTEQVNNTAFDNLTEVQGPKTENITASLDSVLMAEDGQDFSILSGPVTVSGTVNYLDDNVTLDETSYTSGIYTISGTVERPDNSTYGSQTNPDITDPVISWDWAVNTTSSDDPINVTISGDENLSSCRLVINGINETMRQYNLTYFYYDWAPSVGNSTLQACCNDTANNTGCTNEAWYELFYPPEETPHHHACSKAWQCTAWSSCVNGKQARTCDCGCDHDADCTGSSDEEQSCTVQAPNCTASWSCTNWGNCVNSLQSRVCTCSCPNDNDCYGDHQTSQACECDSAADCDDGNICTADSCATGTCQHLPANTTCSDNNPCTLNDYCANGACVPGNNTCECLTDADCNDGNICTADSCLNNACQFAYTSDPCDDANDCTANDYCMDGVCTPGPFTCPCQTDADCNDNNPCTDESCVSTVCTYSDANASCDDGSDCTLNDYCSKGLCVSGKDACRKACNDAWSCTDWGSCVNGDAVQDLQLRMRQVHGRLGHDKGLRDRDSALGRPRHQGAARRRPVADKREGPKR